MKTIFIPIVLLAMASAALANTAPTVVIQSAAMRPGTTLMDVAYRVNDPDDATVKTRALAFVGGVRSFANVIKPVTFVEGTAAKLGDSIPANVYHTLTWDVAADWDIDLGQINFEVLAMDGRGLLPIDWITIPAAGGKPALTISKDTPSDSSVLSGLFWQYADGDTGLSLTNGVLRGTSTNGVFSGVDLANGATLPAYARPFLFKRINLDPASTGEIRYAADDARAGLLNTADWHAANRPYAGITIIVGLGSNANLSTIPSGLGDVTAIAASGFSGGLALQGNGTVVGWGSAPELPDGLTGVTAIAAGSNHGLALKSDGTVVGMGFGTAATPPAGLTGVTAIAASSSRSVALKSDQTMVGWGSGIGGTATPTWSDVIAITGGTNHFLAIRSGGTVSGWGTGFGTIPAGLTGVTAIAAGYNFSLALNGDGTVVGWGTATAGYAGIPADLTGVTAIAAGYDFGLALKSDGSVVGWGSNSSGQITIPVGLTGVARISASRFSSSQGFTLLLKSKGL
jgi:hypothetical protein